MEVVDLIAGNRLQFVQGVMVPDADGVDMNSKFV